MTEGDSQASTAHVYQKHPAASPQTFDKVIKSSTGKVEKIDKTYHHAKVDGLSPNTIYYFKVGDSKIGYSKEYKFKTLPDDDSPIKIVAGGDMSPRKKIIAVSKFALSTSPHVLLIGGDIAYANGSTKYENRWISWFKRMNEIMFTQDGFLIPMILAIGNHETSSRIRAFSKAPFYFELFPQNNKKSYFIRKLGSNAVLIVLDSGHMIAHKQQKEWLQNALIKHQKLPHRLALYHAPLYPSHRVPNNFLAVSGRASWLELFDKYSLTAAFENHDHAFKRTKILKGHEVSKKGTVYLGDGCWGVGTRETKSRWFLQKVSSSSHVWSATIFKNHINFMASGKNAKIYDHFNLSNTEHKTKVEEL